MRRTHRIRPTVRIAGLQWQLPETELLDHPDDFAHARICQLANEIAYALVGRVSDLDELETGLAAFHRALGAEHSAECL